MARPKKKAFIVLPKEETAETSLAAIVNTEVARQLQEQPVNVEVAAYDDAQLRLEMSHMLTKRLPAMYDHYVTWMNKNDVAQGRWKPDFVHFIKWLKEYYN